MPTSIRLPNNIRYVLFDIDDTLFPSSEFSALARKNALNAMIGMGLKADFQTLNSRLEIIIRSRGSNYQKHFNELCTQMHVKNPDRFIAAAIAAYHDTKATIQPFPEVPRLLLSLKRKGFKVYVATHGNPVKQWDKLIRLGLALYFDDVFVAGTNKKKDKQFFAHIIKTLNSKPETILMVGDREDADILPAKSLGIKTVRVMRGKYADMPAKSRGFTSPKESQADLVIHDISELEPALSFS